MVGATPAVHQGGLAPSESVSRAPFPEQNALVHSQQPPAIAAQALLSVSARTSQKTPHDAVFPIQQVTALYLERFLYNYRLILQTGTVTDALAMQPSSNAAAAVAGQTHDPLTRPAIGAAINNPDSDPTFVYGSFAFSDTKGKTPIRDLNVCIRGNAKRVSTSDNVKTPSPHSLRKSVSTAVYGSMLTDHSAGVIDANVTIDNRTAAAAAAEVAPSSRASTALSGPANLQRTDHSTAIKTIATALGDTPKTIEKSYVIINPAHVCLCVSFTY